MPELLLNLALALTALGVTLTTGIPLIFGFSNKGRLFTKLALSFVLGYVLLSILGILSIILEINPFIIQTGAILMGAASVIRYKSQFLIDIDNDDLLVLGMGFLYLLLCLLFFDRIIMWMSSDAVVHASIMRMLLDGKQVPISIYPLGSYWDYYPKAFHLYSFYWAKTFPILNVIQTIPVLISTITPVLLYSVVREMGKKKEALYVFILACFVFSAHYSYLIWGGYPSATAEMLLVACILAILVDIRLIPLLLLCMVFTHTRVVVLAVGSLFAWAAATRLRSYLPYILASCAVLTIAALMISPAVRPPDFIISVFNSQKLASEYVARWYPAFLSLFGGLIALQRRDLLDRLALSWTGALVIIMLLADCGVLRFLGTADRLMLALYLPLSLLAAVSLSRMDVSDTKISTSFMLVLLLMGIIGMGAVFHSYAVSWGLPQEDYNAIMWLSNQNLSDAFCINLDETGLWVYPMTGISVSNPKYGPETYYSHQQIAPSIVKDPNDEKALEEMRLIGPKDVLVYVSAVSISRPGYLPPFANNVSAYPVVNLNFSQDSYELLYNGGARIFKLKKAE